MNGEVLMRREGLVATSGVKKKRRQGKEADFGGKKARVGIKGTPRRPRRALDHGRTAGVVATVKGTVKTNNWTIRSPASQQSKKTQFSRSDVIFRNVRGNTKDTTFGVMKAPTTNNCARFTSDSLVGSNALPHTDQKLILGDVPRGDPIRNNKGRDHGSLALKLQIKVPTIGRRQRSPTERTAETRDLVREEVTCGVGRRNLQ